MNFVIHEENKVKFVDEGEGEILLLLHGLFGALSNWTDVINHFSSRYRVIIPFMPIYEMSVRNASIEGLVEFVEKFVSMKNLKNVTLLGNSLGGHVGLVYLLKNPDNVKRLVLTGSSGLFENGMGGSFPKRGDYNYISERVKYTFYDPNTASKELVDEVFTTLQSISKCMSIVQIAKSAQRHNMSTDVPQIKKPTLLIWGLNDTITPPHVGHEFNRLIAKSQLYFIDHCGHAPMMEQPEKFNKILEKFLSTT